MVLADRLREKVGEIFGGFIPGRDERASGEKNFFHMGCIKRRDIRVGEGTGIPLSYKKLGFRSLILDKFSLQKAGILSE